MVQGFTTKTPKIFDWS